MALITRAMPPRFSIASCIASAFITVASMPMWSPVTRSMPAAASPAPRKMLPPPMTTPIWMPARCTSMISSRQSADHFRVDAVVGLTHQCFTGEFEQDAVVLAAGRSWNLRIVCGKTDAL
jgi:hypothetical protein